jgi:DNA-3-methyladenine glycosylase
VGRRFFARGVVDVATALLGCYIVHTMDDVVVGGRIVETEAYGGPGDPGSHAHRAPSGRARIMFGPAGVVYVYFTYGMHHCMNLVAEHDGKAGAVLLRAIEPVWGISVMRRGAPPALKDHLLASGPGRMCRALRVDRDLNGAEVARGPITVHRRKRSAVEVHSGVRVGLSDDDGREWRFWLNSPSVSATAALRTPGSGRRS